MVENLPLKNQYVINLFYNVFISNNGDNNYSHLEVSRPYDYKKKYRSHLGIPVKFRFNSAPYRYRIPINMVRKRLYPVRHQSSNILQQEITLEDYEFSSDLLGVQISKRRSYKLHERFPLEFLNGRFPYF